MQVANKTVYVVATPIGHLADLSLRAIHVLQQCDMILCEDTRVSRVLLKHHAIQTPMKAMHRFNEAEVVQAHVGRLLQGEKLAIISDAGTPLIQDPGGRLVRACHAHGIDVVPIPGASAVMAALSVAGFDASHFEFIGFMPTKATMRTDTITQWRTCQHIMMAFEVPHRIVATLQCLAAHLPKDRTVVLARELTKKFETVVRTTAGGLLAWLASEPVLKGEWVVMVGPAHANVETLSPLGLKALQVLLQRCSVKDSVAMAATLSGDRKNLLYTHAMRLSQAQDDTPQA